MIDRKPFDGAITRYFEDDAPEAIRAALKTAEISDILDPTYPYAARMENSLYMAEMTALQIELAKFHAWVRERGQRIAVIFEGRDAAGKGGAIARVMENLNPRVAQIVALSKPSETEAGQWYFQRYIQHLPSRGQIRLFDRSWYNRGVVEHVFGFCTPAQREAFFAQAPRFEDMLLEDGISLTKIWLNLGRAEQLRRFLARENDPLKHWKLSRIDVDGLAKWHEYSAAIRETLTRTHTATAPWHVIRADDKRRARLAVIRQILSQYEYPEKDPNLASAPDPAISGGPEAWTDQGDNA